MGNVATGVHRDDHEHALRGVRTGHDVRERSEHHLEYGAVERKDLGGVGRGGSAVQLRSRGRRARASVQCARLMTDALRGAFSSSAHSPNQSPAYL